ncbi:MAG: hypothetical protein O2907_05615 [Proteobacteria bacterium]|nr:hypothetical protein [Pseudomonadota bacterium]MDA1063797.1 hypothetical protein [Pseudomonadota bacterium]
MDERLMKAMVAAGAIKKINIIASGARFHIEANTANGAVTAETHKGKVKTWVSLDAAARWVRSLGMGAAHIHLTHWQPGQRELPV